MRVNINRRFDFFTPNSEDLIMLTKITFIVFVIKKFFFSLTFLYFLGMCKRRSVRYLVRENNRQSKSLIVSIDE